jgi:thiamine biosynthesis lipoprotein ApbE
MIGERQKPAARYAKPIQAAIDETFYDIDRKLSNYRDDSEISRFNQQTPDWVPVSPEVRTAPTITSRLRAAERRSMAATRRSQRF